MGVVSVWRHGMGDINQYEPIVEPIFIRYNGLDADRYEIELTSLAESLKGLSRIIGVTSNLALTERYVQHKDALAVRVVTRAPEAKCFEMVAWVKWAAEQPLIAGTLATLLATLITYVISRAARQREEMKHLREALEVAIKELGHRDQPMVDRLLSTIDKMADSLRPAVKQAVAPIGDSVSMLTIGGVRGGASKTIGTAEREAILTDDPVQVTTEQTYHIVITELDMETGGCKVELADEPDARYQGKITDPAFSISNNAYALAMAARQQIAVRGKATVRDGTIERLHISNIA